jgi:hypothetical protein
MREGREIGPESATWVQTWVPNAMRSNKITDSVLRFLWVVSYALLIRFFGLLRSIERLVNRS